MGMNADIQRTNAGCHNNVGKSLWAVKAVYEDQNRSSSVICLDSVSEAIFIRYVGGWD